MTERAVGADELRCEIASRGILRATPELRREISGGVLPALRAVEWCGDSPRNLGGTTDPPSHIRAEDFYFFTLRKDAEKSWQKNSKSMG